MRCARAKQISCSWTNSRFTGTWDRKVIIFDSKIFYFNSSGSIIFRLGRQRWYRFWFFYEINTQKWDVGLFKVRLSKNFRSIFLLRPFQSFQFNVGSNGKSLIMLSRITTFILFLRQNHRNYQSCINTDPCISYLPFYNFLIYS